MLSLMDVLNVVLGSIFVTRKEIKLISNDPIEDIFKEIKNGKIVAIKGIGGFHLACDAKNKEVINELRKRKKRPRKPLAVMMRDFETVKKYCDVNELEEKILLR